MMRSPSSMSIVCRRRSGELVVRERSMPPLTRGWRTLPLLRGVATVVESVRLGSQALRWSAELYEQDLRAEESKTEDLGRPPNSKPGAGASVTSALAVAFRALAYGTLSVLFAAEPDATGREAQRSAAPGEAQAAPSAPSAESAKRGLAALPLIFALGLFVALPQAAAEGLSRLFGWNLPVTSPAFQAITGACKLAIVVGYLLAIRQVPDIRRVFQYHGAEHKAISTYESGEALSVANARAKTTAHPRCGTTFLVMVALVSILVFSAVGSFLPQLPGGRLVANLGLFAMKLPFLPVIAAITFELQRFFARHCTTGPLSALLWPGFLVQRITTAEPDDSQLEVALASLRAALWRAERAAEATADESPDRVFPDYGAVLAHR